MRTTLTGLLIALLLGLPSLTSAAPAKFYVVVRGVEDGEGVKSGIKDEALKLFKDELGRHPELTLTPPPGLPTTDDHQVLKDALKAKGLKALEVTLRILSVKQEVNPPPAGKQFRVLTRSIRLSVFGDSLPDKVMAIGGNGESQVGAEIGASADVDKEGKPLLVDAAKEAIKQAVDMTVAKLQLPDSGKVKLKKKPKTAAKP